MHTTIILATLAILAIMVMILLARHHKKKEHMRSLETEGGTRGAATHMYVGQKSKCYSCEKQAIDMACGNPLAAYGEHAIRYHTLPPIRGMGYPKAGYMG